MNTGKIKEVIHRASKALAEYCMNASIHNTVTGVSGGLDSAVTLALSQEACKFSTRNGYDLRSLGLVIPCHSDPEHTRLGKEVVETFDAKLIEIDLTSTFDSIEASLLKPISSQLERYHDTDHHIPSRYRNSQGNVKARMRMTFGTYYVANMINGLVLSTDNYSEYWMGFWTLHGDVGDFGMIQELWKGDELVQIADYLGVPQDIINAAPTDGLGVLPGGDEAQLGATYITVDRVLQALIKSGFDLNTMSPDFNKLPIVEGIDAKLVMKIASRAIRNGYKRHSPHTLRRSDLGL